MNNRNRPALEANLAKWQKALRDQQEIIRQHKNKVEYCKAVIEGIELELEYLDKIEEQDKIFDANFA